MKLGIAEYMIKGPSDLSTLRSAQRLGLDGVEIQVFRDQLLSPGSDRLAELLEAQQSTGVQVCSLMLPNHSWQCGIGMADPTLAAQGVDEVHRAIDWAAALGAGVLLIPFFGASEILTEVDLQRAVDGFRTVCPHAASRGVHLCFEGTLSAEDIHRMGEGIDSDSFGCYMDVGNVVAFGRDTPTEIEQLGPLVKQVHVKDARITPSDCPPGLGRVDWPETSRALRAMGYDGWIVGEYTVFRDGAQAVPRPPRLPEAVARDLSFTRYWWPQASYNPAWPRLGARTKWFGTDDVPRMIEHFRSCQLSAVQVIGDILDEALEDPAKAGWVRSQLERAGIVMGGLGPYRNLVAYDPDIRRANINHVKKCLEISSHFGTSIVATETGTCHPEGGGRACPENRGKAAWDLLVRALDELVPVAENNRAILALEGHVRHVLQHEGQMLALSDRYSSESLQFVLDPYNLSSQALLPSVQRWFPRFKERWEQRFAIAHLKDVSPQGAEVATPEFGAGVFPNSSYLKWLSERRPDLPIILDDLRPERYPDTAAAVRDSLGLRT